MDRLVSSYLDKVRDYTDIFSFLGAYVPFIWSCPGCGHQQGAEPAEAPRREERDPGERGQEGGAGHRADLPRVRGLRGGRDQGPRQPPRLEGGHDLEVLLRQVSPV